MIKQKAKHRNNTEVIFEFLEERIKDGLSCEREYGLYLDYREDGKKAIKKNKSNLYTWAKLRDEALEIHNSVY